MPTHSQYKADDSKLHEQERDIAKLWNEGNVELAICGVENQTKIEKFMPLRVMGYDGASYRSQLMAKRPKPVPVVTLVLYFGTDRKWIQPMSLKEVLNIPDGMEGYVNDYRIHVDEVLKLLSVMTGDNVYQEVLLSEDRKGVNTMCDVAESLELLINYYNISYTVDVR